MGKIPRRLLSASGMRYNRRKWVKGIRVVVNAKSKPVFRVDTFLASMDGGRSVLNVRKNRKVFSLGDPAQAVFFIQQGQVKVCVTSERGKEAVVAIQSKGDFFGEGCLTGQSLRLATAVAMTECVITRIDKAAMIRVLQEEPKISERFMAFLLARNARRGGSGGSAFQLERKASGKDPSADGELRKRGWSRAGDYESQSSDSRGDHRHNPVPCQRFMNKFRKLGLISYNGDLEIHNSLLTMVLHETPRIRRDPEAEA